MPPAGADRPESPAPVFGAPVGEPGSAAGPVPAAASPAAGPLTGAGGSVSAGGSALPSVGVVLPTHNRPELMRRALDTILAQDYAGPLRVVVVYDRAEPDLSLARGGDRPFEVVTNART